MGFAHTVPPSVSFPPSNEDGLYTDKPAAQTVVVDLPSDPSGLNRPVAPAAPQSCHSPQPTLFHCCPQPSLPHERPLKLLPIYPIILQLSPSSPEEWKRLEIKIVPPQRRKKAPSIPLLRCKMKYLNGTVLQRIDTSE